MTFNTTELPSLGKASGPVRVFDRKPRIELPNPVGRLSVTEEIANLLDGKLAFGEFPDVDAEKLIGRFCAGHLLYFSRKKVVRKKKDLQPELERLEGFDEIWCLCPRKPIPGWRLLGRFHGKNHLVLLRPWDKRKLANNYELAAKEVVDDWQKLTGSASAYQGKDLADYYSGHIRDVDEPQK